VNVTKVEMVQAALAQLGDVSSRELSEFIERKLGVNIEPKFIPLFKASIRDKENLAMTRATRTVSAPAMFPIQTKPPELCA
jgi:hypothetical protein